jgi:hypothetical protein
MTDTTWTPHIGANNSDRRTIDRTEPKDPVINTIAFLKWVHLVAGHNGSPSSNSGAKAAPSPLKVSTHVPAA